MKKKLSLILAVAVIFQIVTLPVYAWQYVDWAERAKNYGSAGISTYEDTDVIIGPGEDAPTSDEGVVQKKTAAYNKLGAIGIVRGDSNDTPTDGGGITRAAFVQMVIRALNLEGAGGSEQVFVDVPKDHFAFNEIGVAVGLGIVSGYNGYFEADEKITYLDAAVMLVNALGMRDEAIYRGGYHSGYLTVANRYDILSRTEVADIWAIADANTLYQMLLNTVESEDLAVLEAIGPDSVKYKNGRNMLEVYHKIYTAEGVVDAVGQSNILSNKEYANDQVKMGELLLKGNYAECVNYLGIYTEILYRENSANENEILYIEVSKNNKMVTFSADDIVSYDNGTYTYYQGDKKRTAKVAGDASLVYNGKINTVGIENPYIPEMGFVTLVSNTGSGAYNIVKVDSMTDLVVGTVISDDGVIYDYLDRSISINMDIEDTDKVINLINTEGATVYPTMATQKNILSIYQSADGRVINAVLSNKTAAGSIEKVMSDDGHTVVTINGTDYRISRRCQQNFSKLLISGNQVTLFLNAFGDAAYMEEGIIGGSSDMNYAYVIAAKENNTGFSSEVLIKLLNADGTITEEKLPEKCTIDETRYKDGGKQITALDRGLAIGRVIMCAKDAEGFIYKIDTAYVDEALEEKKSTLHPLYTKAMLDQDKADGILLNEESNAGKLFHKVTDNGGFFSEAIYWTKDKTVLFVINNAESRDEDKYRVETLTSPFVNDAYYLPEIYGDDNDSYAEACVHTIENAGTGSVASNVMWVVKNVVTTLYDEEIMTGIEVTTGKTTKTVVIDPSKLNEVSLEIEEGDIINFDEVNGKIIGKSIAKLYDYSDDKKVGDNQWFNDIFRREAGYVYDVEEGLYTMYITDDIQDLAGLENSNLVGNKKVLVNRTNGCTFVKVTKNSKGGVNIESVSANALMPYLGVGAEASRIFISFRYMSPQYVYIFERGE